MTLCQIFTLATHTSINYISSALAHSHRLNGDVFEHFLTFFFGTFHDQALSLSRGRHVPEPHRTQNVSIFPLRGHWHEKDQSQGRNGKGRKDEVLFACQRRHEICPSFRP